MIKTQSDNIIYYLINKSYILFTQQQSCQHFTPADLLRMEQFRALFRKQNSKIEPHSQRGLTLKMFGLVAMSIALGYVLAWGCSLAALARDVASLLTAAAVRPPN